MVNLVVCVDKIPQSSDPDEAANLRYDSVTRIHF